MVTSSPRPSRSRTAAARAGRRLVGVVALVAALPLLAGCGPTTGRHTAVLSVTGTGRGWIAWAVLGDDPVGPTVARAELPWQRTVSTSSGASGSLTAWSVSVTDGGRGGETACRITVDGRVLDSERGRGGVDCEADLRAS